MARSRSPTHHLARPLQALTLVGYESAGVRGVKLSVRGLSLQRGHPIRRHFGQLTIGHAEAWITIQLGGVALPSSFASGCGFSGGAPRQTAGTPATPRLAHGTRQCDGVPTGTCRGEPVCQRSL